MSEQYLIREVDPDFHGLWAKAIIARVAHACHMRAMENTLYPAQPERRRKMKNGDQTHHRAVQAKHPSAHVGKMNRSELIEWLTSRGTEVKKRTPTCTLKKMVLAAVPKENLEEPEPEPPKENLEEPEPEPSPLGWVVSESTAPRTKVQWHTEELRLPRPTSRICDAIRDLIDAFERFPRPSIHAAILDCTNELRRASDD